MSSPDIVYRVRTATWDAVAAHLRACASSFVPPLDTYVDIDAYARKIAEHAETFEAWQGDRLVGLAAAYFNDRATRRGYLTNLSVLAEHQGAGIASALTAQVVDFGVRNGFVAIGLEAKVGNENAIRFYQRRDFVVAGSQGDAVVMTRALGTGAIPPVVSVCCATYNHERFIRAAVDSFLMQQTSFPIEILIHDDASTDATGEIVAEYQARWPGVFVHVRQPKNLYSQGVRGLTCRFLLPRTRGAYVALCEGDDYWTDPLKLQKQVDFLEAHPDFSGAFHETQQLLADGTPGRLFGEKAPDVMMSVDTFSTLSPFHTSSFVFRNQIRTWPAWLGDVVSGDMAMFSILSSLGPLKKVPGVMSVYRKHPDGITSSAAIVSHYHQKRIELMTQLNAFHGGKFEAKAREVIAFHTRALAKVRAGLA